MWQWSSEEHAESAKPRDDGSITGQQDELCPITLTPFTKLNHPAVILPNCSHPFELNELVHWLKIHKTNPTTNERLRWRHSAAEVVGIIESTRNSDCLFDYLDSHLSSRTRSLKETFTDPCFVAYNLIMIASIVKQNPLAECTTLYDVDLCGICNALTVLGGCIYSGTRFGNENRRTGWLALVMAVHSKLFSSTALLSDSVPSIMIAFLIYALNICIHVFEICGFEWMVILMSIILHWICCDLVSRGKFHMPTC